MVAYLIIAACSFVLALFLTGMLRSYTLEKGMLDIPNERSSHRVPTPRGGGMAMAAVFVAALVLLGSMHLVSSSLLLVLLPAGVLVAAAGWLDDRRPVAAPARLGIHLMAAAAGLYFLEEPPALPLFGLELTAGALGYIVLATGLVWSVNLNNFMDGIDGIAAVEAICVAAGISLVIWINGGDMQSVRVLVLLAAVSGGFLYWNWPPARIFMGDAGSGFLGMTIGLLALATSAGEAVNLWSWCILYGVFIVDATYTLGRRILRGERFLEAHRSHAYQILSRRLRSHRKVTIGVGVINICWLFPLAVVSSRYPSHGLMWAAVALTPLVVLAARAGAGKREVIE